MTDRHGYSNWKRRLVLAGVAGLMQASAFPKLNMSVLAWVAPGLILLAGMGLDGPGKFRVGYVAGLVFHLVGLHWLLFIPVKVAPIVGWLLLSSFLALYQGLWVWLCWRILPTPPHQTGVVTVREQFLANRWTQQLVWTLSCAALWVALEMIQARLFTGFPWNLLGASQFQLVPLIQLASVTGVYGISFLLVWVSLSIVSAASSILLRPDRPRDWMAEVFPPVFVVVVILGFGLRSVRYAPAPKGALRVALVQPSIPQRDIWDAGKAAQRFGDLIQLSRRALAENPDLLVWPEAAMPNLYRFDTNINRVVTNLVREHRVWMAFGTEDFRWRPNARVQTDSDYYNSAMLLAPDGNLRQGYYKRKLVIFGEYVPLADWLPFLREFTTVPGDFTAGLEASTFVLTNLNVRFGVSICFEDNFATLIRDGGDSDLDFILNLTNNGWFGDSAAQWQHAANAVFRAVENRVPLVRCTNNGLTCWVDATGRMHDVYFKDTKDVYGAGYKIVRVPILAGEKRKPPFYARHGDVFGWACVAWAALMALTRGRKSGF